MTSFNLNYLLKALSPRASIYTFGRGTQFSLLQAGWWRELISHFTLGNTCFFTRLSSLRAANPRDMPIELWKYGVNIVLLIHMKDKYFGMTGGE